MQHLQTEHPELLGLIVDYIPPAYRPQCRAVGRAWRAATNARKPTYDRLEWDRPATLKPRPEQYKKIELAMLYDPYGIAYVYAYRGQLDLLRWAHERGCPVPYATFIYAAAGGRIDVLEWLLSSAGDDTTTVGALVDVECACDLTQIVDQGQETDPEIVVAYYGYSSAKSAVVAAGRSGRIAVVEWILARATSALRCRLGSGTFAVPRRREVPLDLCIGAAASDDSRVLDLIPGDLGDTCFPYEMLWLIAGQYDASSWCEWLCARDRLCPTIAMSIDSALANGRMRVARWLLTVYPRRLREMEERACTGRDDGTIDRAALSEQIEWIDANVEPDQNVAAYIVRTAPHTNRLVFDLDPETAREVRRLAAATGVDPRIARLRGFVADADPAHPGSFLCSSRSSGGDVSFDVDVAMSEGDLDVLADMYRLRRFVPTSAIFMRALSSERIRVLEWLLCIGCPVPDDPKTLWRTALTRHAWDTYVDPPYRAVPVIVFLRKRLGLQPDMDVWSNLTDHAMAASPHLGTDFYLRFLQPE